MTPCCGTRAPRSPLLGVAGGWWLVAGGWWLVAGGCQDEVVCNQTRESPAGSVLGGSRRFNRVHIAQLVGTRHHQARHFFLHIILSIYVNFTVKIKVNDITEFLF